ncbi:hypothetical protein T4E_6677 [Trichinella pseudospiralis]|uniref:Uncharacterized protein n=1 Tax=Trichinella pseudospiralis TaxID=6337 RepID=A0A0V0YAQ7_TRIPS|nr:hypothetical protein T4E_6677 [Trichinella pseudospiralis]
MPPWSVLYFKFKLCQTLQPQVNFQKPTQNPHDGGCPRTAPQLSDGKIRRAIQQGYNLNKLVVCNPHGQASHRFGDGGIKSVTSQIHPPKVTSSQLANTLLNSSKIDDSVVFHQICSLDRQNICGSDVYFQAGESAFHIR